MVRIEPFAVEQWMDEHETWAKYNIAETCCASISLDDLVALSENEILEGNTPLSTATKLTYGHIRGSMKLRTNLAKVLCTPAREGLEPLSPDNILITPGAIQANFLLLYTLVGPGDHVICHYPTYQQLYSVPGSLGAEVSLWKSDERREWALDVEQLRALIRPNTKLIIINNPQNPTGAVVPGETLKVVINIAREKSIFVLCDEVYRPLFHSIDQQDWPPSVVSLGYERAIATGSMSKAFALAGIRLGWITSRNKEVIEACAAARDYTTISVSQLDDQVASFALDTSRVERLLDRNSNLARKNLSILAKFIEQHRDTCHWVHPGAGTTAFVQFLRGGNPVDDVVFCDQLQQKTGVMFVPGRHCFGYEFRGFVRIGYVSETEVLRVGLEKLAQFMVEEFANIPCV